MRRLLLRKAQYEGLKLRVHKDSDFLILFSGLLGESYLNYRTYGKNKIHVFASKKSMRSFFTFLREKCEGVSYGFFKSMFLQGIGYRVWTNGKELLLQIGYNHLVKYRLPATMTAYGKKSRFVLFGISKEEVNRIAQRLVWLKYPDSYKGKGVRYENVFLVLKKGKNAKKG
jgi:ribosomal protein L6P/L9E